jgi:hypothetical protein
MSEKEATRRKQMIETREQTKRLICTIEQRLPPRYKSKPQRNGAGTSRSLGTGGRALNDVLKDVRTFVAEKKLRGETDSSPSSLATLPAPGGQSTSVCGELARAGLFSAHNLLCFEVEMGGEQDWLISASGQGAARRWSAAQWLGDGVGHSFSQLVHRHDFFKLLTQGRQCLAASQPCPPIDVRVVVFDKVSWGENSERILTCRYELFTLHAHALPSNSPTSACRILVLGIPRRNVFLSAASPGRCQSAYDLSCAQPRSTPPSPMMAAITGRRASPSLGLRGQSLMMAGAGDFDSGTRETGRKRAREENVYESVFGGVSKAAGDTVSGHEWGTRLVEILSEETLAQVSGLQVDAWSKSEMEGALGFLFYYVNNNFLCQ